MVGCRKARAYNIKLYRKISAVENSWMAKIIQEDNNKV
jgi:hypothetical protein